MELKATLHLELNGKTLKREEIISHPEGVSIAYEIAFEILKPFKQIRSRQESTAFHRTIKNAFDAQKSDSPE